LAMTDTLFIGIKEVYNSLSNITIIYNKEDKTMPHCRACDKLLTDQEACYKDKKTDTYVELCNGCSVVHRDAVYGMSLTHKTKTFKKKTTK